MKKILNSIVLLLFFTLAGYGQTISLISAGSSWKYLANGSNQGTAWRASSFNDASWATGNAQLGYGDGDEATVVGYGPNANNKYITTYFRKSITVANPALYSTLKIYVMRDDGAVVYLNGTEVARSNISSGTVGYTKLATLQISGSGESTYYSYTVNKSLLLAGNNVIAVEVHQYNGSSPDISFDFKMEVTAAATCNVASSLSASALTTVSATLNWASVSGAVSYNIQYRPIGSGTWTSTTSATNSKAISALSPSTNYEWQVQTVCSAGSSAYSASSNFTTSALCGIPSGQNATGITTTAATLNWTAVSGATNYNIQFRPVGWSIWTNTNSANNAVGITSLSPSTNYEWQVQTVCSAGSSAYSASSNFTTSALCGVPSGQNTTGITTVAATLNWTAVSGATNYNIQFRPIGGSIWTNTNSATNSVGITSLSPATNYEWQVQTVCAAGSSAYSVSSNFTTSALCGISSGQNTTGITTTTATLNWTAVSGATNYNIQFRPVGGSIWTNTNSATNSVGITSLSPATNYEWQVQAICSVGSSAYSASSNFTTSSLCGIPSGQNTTGITTTTATLNWTAVSGATNYNIQLRPVGGSIWTNTNSATNTVGITSLSPATNYEWQVQAVCPVGSSAYSTSSNFTTTSGCGVATGLATSGASVSSINLNWGAVAGALSYNIQFRPSGTSTWTIITAVNNSATANALLSATLYEWMVQAICSGGTGPFSAISTFSTIATGTDSLITTNSNWKFLDNGSNQGTAWQAPGFNDGSWSSGNAELGYGDGGEATVLNYGGNANAKYVTTYFRKSFNVSNPLAYILLKMGVVRDDGIIVYLNGTEVYRNNMPTGTISYTTLSPVAIGNADESAWNVATLNPASLVQGVNVIAVEIHQQALNSTDISFNLRLYASGQLPPPAIVRGPYLQKLTSNGITIRWRTDAPSDSKVQYGPTTSYGGNVTDATQVTEHIVNISGLSPAAKYYYSIGASGYVLQGDTNNNFMTAPVTGTVMPIRLWVTGDFGNGSSSQDNVRNAYMNYPGANATNLWLWLGDNAYNSGTDAEFQSYVFNHYPAQFKKFPLYPAPGNHDYGNIGYQSATSLGTNFAYYSIFSVPQAGEAGGVASNTPKYYSYNYGNIHFISLDSYGALNNSSSPMYQWLSSDLAANTQRWIIAYWHHPPYTKGTHNSDTDAELINIRNNIIPLLESYHVDLVLCGHSHVNERSYMIKGHYGLSNTFNASMKMSASNNTFFKSSPYDGTVYATCGTSGQNPSTLQAGAPMPCMYFTNNTDNCSMVIDVNGDVLSAKYLNTSGSIVDQFTITKSIIREGAPSIKNGTEAYYNPSENMIFLGYHLNQPAAVKVELVNLLGVVIKTFRDIPSYQAAGFYWQELSLAGFDLQDGIYLLRLKVNDHMEVKKLLISN